MFNLSFNEFITFCTNSLYAVEIMSAFYCLVAHKATWNIWMANAFCQNIISIVSDGVSQFRCFVLHMEQKLNAGSIAISYPLGVLIKRWRTLAMDGCTLFDAWECCNPGSAPRTNSPRTLLSVCASRSSASGTPTSIACQLSYSQSSE